MRQLTNLAELKLEHEYFINDNGFIKKKYIAKYKRQVIEDSTNIEDITNIYKFVGMRVIGSGRYGTECDFDIDTEMFDSGRIQIFYPEYEEREAAAHIRNDEKRAELASRTLPNEANEQLKYIVAEYFTKE